MSDDQQLIEIGEVGSVDELLPELEGSPYAEQLDWLAGQVNRLFGEAAAGRARYWAAPDGTLVLDYTAEEPGVFVRDPETGVVTQVLSKDLYMPGPWEAQLEAAELGE